MRTDGANKVFRAADLFCGAGGASTGLVRACEAFGVRLELLAVNHWSIAVETHTLNHPQVRHLCESVERIDPRAVVPGGRLHLLLAGPECTHFSTARGGRPVNPQSRASAWHILKWAQELYIDTILIENVPEFRTWGPIGANHKPLKSRKGETYQAFLAALRSLGYTVEDRILNAADYGDPTTRRRLFIMARRGHHQVRWPAPTHSRTGGKTLFGTTKRWRPAREVIDWSVPGKSIFNRKKPLRPATIARILAGLEKFGGPELRPFLVVLRQHMAGRSVDLPLPTSVDEPIPVLPASPKFGVAQPFILPPLRFNPSRTSPVDEPLPTISATGGRLFGLAEPFLTKYNRTATGAYSVEEPIDTISTRDRFGLVQPVIDGYVLDIHFRMLQPHELAAATSFPKSYVFQGTREDVVKQIGNAWPGELATALSSVVVEDYAGRKARASRREEAIA